MTGPLPEGITKDDEISVVWDQTDDVTRVTAELGGASIVVVTDDASAHLVPWLVASAPQILEAAWAQIEEQDPATTQEEP